MRSQGVRRKSRKEWLPLKTTKTSRKTRIKRIYKAETIREISLYCG